MFIRIKSGHEVQIDEEDLKVIEAHSWRLHKEGSVYRSTTITKNGVRKVGVAVSLGREILRTSKNVYRLNKDGLDYRKENLKTHIGRRNDQRKRYYEDNKKEILRKHNIYLTNKRRVDMRTRIINALRSRMYQALKNKQKVGSAVRDLGCTGEELKRWLEIFFDKGMTWDNYGTEWHIDHVKPLASFDLTDREQFLEACNYRNLQPLWAKDNLIKSSDTLWYTT